MTYKNEHLEMIREAMEDFFSYLDEILPKKRDEEEDEAFLEWLNKSSQADYDEGEAPF